MIMNDSNFENFRKAIRKEKRCRFLAKNFGASR